MMMMVMMMMMIPLKNNISMLSGSCFQSGLQCQTLRIPQGVLKGISRRMSSLFFGSATSQSVSEVSPFKRIMLAYKVSLYNWSARFYGVIT